MKIYIDAIEDEYPFTVYAVINPNFAKEEQQLFIGPAFITYTQINNNFAQVWGLLMSSMEVPSDVHNFAIIMQKQSLLASALSEFVNDIDIHYSASSTMLHQYQNEISNDSPASGGLNEDNLDNSQELNEEPDPEITTLDEIESHPPSRATTLGY